MHRQQKSIIENAVLVAEKSKMQVQHGCVIVNSKGEVIAKAFNKYTYLHNICKPWHKGQRLSCHAEEGALKNVDPKKLVGAKLYVVRLSYCGELMNSKPCDRCTGIIEKYMDKYGLKTAYYSL